MDREKVIRAVDSCFDYWLDKHEYLCSSELEHVRQIKADALALLEEQEAVVRCKNCKYGEVWNNCIMCNSGAHNPDWFCADGRKRDE